MRKIERQKEAALVQIKAETLERQQKNFNENAEQNV
jgi:hypothetical protein